MIKGFGRLIRNFFGFSHGEAKGFLLLIWLVLAVILAYLVYRNLPAPGYTSYAEDRALLDSLLLKMEAAQEPRPGYLAKLDTAGLDGERVALLFSFDPNLLSADSLLLLGLPPWLASRIEKYRQKGGRFLKKEDLQKIYGLPDSTYARLAPYIRIKAFAREGEKRAKASGTGNEPPTAFPSGKEKNRTMLRLDLNKADSLELQRLRGIGPVLSGRIVRFRQKLGGFVSLAQLYEVWGLDSAVVESISERLFITEEFTPRPLRINSAPLEELAAHPYLNHSQARLLLAYRSQHGPFQTSSELLNIHTFDSVFVEKVAPYIRFD